MKWLRRYGWLAQGACVAALTVGCRSSSALDRQSGTHTAEPLGASARETSMPAPAASAQPSTGSAPEAPAPAVLDPRVYDTATSPTEASEPLAKDGEQANAQHIASQERQVCRVAAMGDSLTDPKAHGGKYLDVLRQKSPKSRFDSYGKGGEMVNQMRRRFARDILGEPPTPGKPAYTHVIVFGGVNDLYSDLTAGRTVDKITRDLAAMYEAAHERGMKVIAITVAPWGGFGRYFNDKRGRATEALNAWILAQEADGKVDAVVDAYALLSCGVPTHLCPKHFTPFRDGIHFGKTGHAILGQALHDVAFSHCL